MPLPREETTPPVTKMYFVELTDSPPSVGGSTASRPCGDRPRYPRPALRVPETTPRRSASRAAAAAAAPAAPNAPPAPAPAEPTAQAPPACTHTRPRAGDTARRSRCRDGTGSARARSRWPGRARPPRPSRGSGRLRVSDPDRLPPSRSDLRSARVPRRRGTRAERRSDRDGGRRSRSLTRRRPEPREGRGGRARPGHLLLARADPVPSRQRERRAVSPARGRVCVHAGGACAVGSAGAGAGGALGAAGAAAAAAARDADRRGVVSGTRSAGRGYRGRSPHGRDAVDPPTEGGESVSSTKYIFVTGGVVSSLGKGIAAASLGRLLVERGLRVTIQKFDPYINVDPGTMSPFQHGEVYVTDDGAETDLDLG